MNDTNDTILPLNKTKNQTLAFIEENFNQTYYNGGIFLLDFIDFYWQANVLVSIGL